MLNVNFEGKNVVGSLQSEGIVLTINPEAYDEQIEAEVMSAVAELLAFYQFKNKQPHDQKAAPKEKIKLNVKKKDSCEANKEVTAKAVTMNPADLVITEGACQGKTFKEAFAAEGIRSIEFLANYAKDEIMKATAAQFINELEA